MTDACSRFTLRQLPLPAKLVLTVFLISVGLGYVSAMLQLHFKHASGGSALPTLADTVARFSGRAWPLRDRPAAQPETASEAPASPPREVARMAIRSILIHDCVACHSQEGQGKEPTLGKFGDDEKDRSVDWAAVSKILEPTPQKSKMHRLITATDPDLALGKDSMVKAFTTGHPDWKEDVATRAEKLGGNKQLAAEELKKDREKERLALVYWVEKGAPKEAVDKDTFDVLLPSAESSTVVKGSQPEDPDKKAKRRQLSADSLTQSTHAHLLSFAMLWALTGLTFAFTSYPLWLRCTLAPAVLVAQVADVSCWWLARLDGVGPYFALAIMGTGGMVGLGVMSQIVLSLFNMYGCKGKAVLAALFLAGASGLGLVYVNHIEPQFAAERQEVQAVQQP